LLRSVLIPPVVFFGFGLGNAQTNTGESMAQTKENILAALATIGLPDGGDLVSRDMIRALQVQDDVVRFVIEQSNHRPPSDTSSGPRRCARRETHHCDRVW